MKVFVTGASGFVGRHLVKALVEAGHEVTIMTRHEKTLPQQVFAIVGDPTKEGQWQESVKTHDVVVNLAGSSIFTRWTEHNKKLITESRVTTTRNIVNAIAQSGSSVKHLINASAVGYYAGHGDDLLDESAPVGNDFLADLGQAWENEALVAEDKGVRTVLCRLGIVLGRDGGALKTMLPFFKVFLGSPFGSGKQWFPWIHIDDLVAIFLFVMKHPELAGAVNCTALNPVRNGEFTRALSKSLHRPQLAPSVPEFLIKRALGEFSTVLLDGKRAVPTKLTESGFTFQYPDLEDALKNLIGD